MLIKNRVLFLRRDSAMLMQAWHCAHCSVGSVSIRIHYSYSCKFVLISVFITFIRDRPQAIIHIIHIRVINPSRGDEICEYIRVNM